MMKLFGRSKEKKVDTKTADKASSNASNPAGATADQQRQTLDGKVAPATANGFFITEKKPDDNKLTIMIEYRGRSSEWHKKVPIRSSKENYRLWRSKDALLSHRPLDGRNAVCWISAGSF